MEMYRSGAIDALSVSFDQTSLYAGTPIHADGTVEDVPPMRVPTNSYAAENFLAKFDREGVGIKLIATNDFQNAPDFYYLDEVPVTFLEGYDDSFLAEASGDLEIVNALISTRLQERLEVVLGDVIRVSLNFTNDGGQPRTGSELYHFDLRIVGSYVQQGIMETIYIPLHRVLDTSMIWDEGQRTDEPASLTFDEGYTVTEEQIDYLNYAAFDSVTFKLTETKTLSQLKDYLSEYGYSQVNKISKLRTFIVLNDAIFNNAVASLQQQIRYVNTLYPFLYLLVGVIAFVVSYLLVVSRRMELATLRGMGASPFVTFMSFFLEQSLPLPAWGWCGSGGLASASGAIYLIAPLAYSGVCPLLFCGQCVIHWNHEQKESIGNPFGQGLRRNRCYF